jgi:hypothetical protein
LKVAATFRVPELVQTVSTGAAALAGFDIVIRRVVRVQRSVSCGRADVSVNVASLPPGNAENDHLPGSGVAKPRFAGAGAGVCAASGATAISAQAAVNNSFMKVP